MGVVLAAGALVVGAVAEAAPNRGTTKGATPTAAPAVGSLAWPSVPAKPSTALQHDFETAAAEFRVPVQVLLGVSYEETLWESHGGRPSTTGNYNVMGLTEVSPTDLVPNAAADLGGSGDGSTALRSSAKALAELHSVDTASPALHTLQTAAALAGVAAKRLRTDMRQSVRGGAALLASYELRLHPQSATPAALPDDPAQWWPAVVAYAQAETPAAGKQFAARVYGVIQQGATRLTDDNQQVTLAASPSVRPAQPASAMSFDGGAAECPSGLACTFTPAAAGRAGNYAQADRPTDGDGIQYLVLHDTGGSRGGALAFFQDPTAHASAHYLVGRDGSVTQLVPTKDVAWHAGNASVDAHSIGIEQEGYALRTGSWYTESEYQSSAALIRYLAARFSVPLDREHVIGHDDVPAPVPGTASATHADPGPYWDWSHLLDLVGAPLTGLHTQPAVGGTVTIAPPYDRTTEPELTGCGAARRACPSHPANFVYLREEPAADAPLLGGGTTRASDVTDKADYGQTFVVAGLSGDWVGVWYGGQEAWFEDPQWRDTLVPDPAAGASLTLVAPVGDQPIPVYGRAYPEASAYPSGLSALAASPAQQLTPLAATIAPGQAYPAGTQLSGDFYAASFDCAGPTGCAVVIGTTQYYPISFDHRLAYVRASDVQLITPAPLPSPSAGSSSSSTASPSAH
ncbi:N-acetylmuramoyl-L-alanine amidase [Streptacidiphilus jiangxiensis]|uniref:N-acetylmuramoyl-L-alanine amidase n=1 Tax=Streptacidiphilus jiangxiensis TaxID=235985 RepID=A0A1H7M099_STRJI|nr:peptidoglycan recognition family protein [Streptacidiphilus jiangxiensis]SEL04155.1 N-acetylmuramoyl-L-alanine amidase [Streptacidiphilus jiangxiensis]